ncbi:MAG: hypothetical protein U0Y68_02785 [Blastocatellia bacterium]
MNEQDVTALRVSTLNAHYTRLGVIRAIYAAIERLGFAARGNLRLLEPAVSVGHFLGAMPPALVAQAERVAVELDVITARILARLYPVIRVFFCGLEDAPLPKDYFNCESIVEN